MYALQRRAKDCGITVSSLHPGIVSYYASCIWYYLRICTYIYLQVCINVQMTTGM